MRMQVSATIDGFDEQTRAYAEFRMFSALARFTREIDTATLVLTGDATPPQAVTCQVSIAFRGGGRLRIRARGGHAYDAINRTIARVGDVLHDERLLAVT
jgi:hypothetical protein